MAKRKRFLVAIPVFNEEQYITEVILKVKQNIDPAITGICIINDGSTDRTSECLHKISDIYKINHKTNMGYGQSIIDGLRFAQEKKYTYVITMDCDRQHEPWEIQKFIRFPDKDNTDIISGSRYLIMNGRERIKIPSDRYKINRKITKKINKLTGYNLTDSFCGFKLYKVDSLKKLHLTEPGYGIPLQIWIQAYRNHLKIRELAVRLIYFDYSRDFNLNFRSSFQRYRYYCRLIKSEVKKNEYYGNSPSS
ncbi:MAG: glycosyltransferase family 2 protein [Spirochaetes bacterium]|nr:glycosyltransferase family 2 protein [Spirochaetota bacterium]